MNRFIVILIIVAFSSLLFASCGISRVENQSFNKEENEEMPVFKVKTTLAKVEQIPIYLEATGTLSSDAKSDVASTIGGKVLSVNFDVGSYVRKGDVLARFDSRDAQIILKQAEAQLDQRRKAVKQAEAGVQQSTAALRQTQVRLGIKDGEVFKIKDFPQVISVAAQLELAEKELKRYENLFKTGDVSHSAYDRAKSQRDQLLGQLMEARSAAAVAIKAVKTSEKAVAAARTKVANAQAAVKTAQTQVDKAQKFVKDNVIYSPISGYVSDRNADPGEYISINRPNSKIATIVRTKILRLKIDIPEQSIGKVKVGQSVSARFSAYPDRNFAGVIARKLPELNPQSRTLTVEAEIKNSGGLLKPGQFATVKITQLESELAVLIPAAAVKMDGERRIVFVITDGLANERVVQTGLLENDMIEIKQGVRENEVIAISNIDKLNDGVIVSQ